MMIVDPGTETRQLDPLNLRAGTQGRVCTYRQVLRPPPVDSPKGLLFRVKIRLDLLGAGTPLLRGSGGRERLVTHPNQCRVLFRYFIDKLLIKALRSL